MKKALITFTSVRNINKGFTLLELLVVIAIIALLSVVVIAAVSDQRVKARLANAQKTMSSVKSAVNVCMATASAINYPTTPGTTPVCANGPVWPTLPTNWGYWASSGASTGNCRDGGLTTTVEVDLVTTDGTYKVCAFSGADARALVCTESACTTATYN